MMQIGIYNNDTKNDITKKEAEKNIFCQVAQNQEDINILLLLSFLSLIFKRIVNSDVIIQQFEVECLRKNAFKIEKLDDLHNILSLIEYEKFIVIDKIIQYIVNQNCEELTNDKINSMIVDIENIIKTNYNEQETLQQQSLLLETNEQKRYTLTPTQGISMLNNNPYSFLINKVLNLSPIDELEFDLNNRYYGTILHQLMQEYAENVKKNCNKFCDNKEIHKHLENIFEQTKNKILNEQHVKVNSFFEKKLLMIKKVAISIELEAFNDKRNVIVEQPYSMSFNNISIYAKADRVEINNYKREIYIYDFKSGLIPTEKQEIDGEKSQLLIIAMLILNTKMSNNQTFAENGYKIKRLRYVDLSGKEYRKDIDININEIAFIQSKIKTLINVFFDEKGLPCLKKMKYINPCGNMLYENDIMLTKMMRKKFV